MNATIAEPRPAADLLSYAQSVIYKWPEGFAGFTAELCLRDGDEEINGTVRALPGPDIDFSLPGASPEDTKWVKQQLSSLVAHRQALPFADGDGKYEISYGSGSDNSGNGEHPLGALVSVADRLRSTYRIRGGWITEIVRHTPGVTVRVYILDRERVTDGRFLPRHLVSTTAVPGTEQVRTVQMLNEQWAEIDGIWLPSVRASVEQSAEGTRYRTLEFGAFGLVGAV